MSVINRKALCLIPAVALALLAGCIVGDQLTTLTIRSDGSADWVRFQSNIRSTEAGAKGAQELKQFVEDFNAHRDADLLHITEAGGQVLEAQWLRREEPYSTVAVAKLPSAAALEEFCSSKGENGALIARSRFTQSANRRRFSVAITVPREAQPSEAGPSTIQQLRQEQGNALSETRVVVAGGHIVDAHGFTVAADRRSALLDATEILQWLRSGADALELFIEWELADK